MNLLITGGCGFLGSNIAASYARTGATLTIIDALFRAGSAQNLAWLRGLFPAGVLRHYRADLAETDAVDRIFRLRGPFDYICHLGGQVAMTTSLADPRRDLLTNVVGTFNVLEAARRRSPDALIAYSSTNKVYGDLRHLRYTEHPSRFAARDYPNGFDESLPLDFASPYGCSKGAADQYVRDWRRNFGLRTVVFRHSSIFGGRQFVTSDQGWIGWFCLKAIEQRDQQRGRKPVRPFTISGTGKQVRDVLFADDLVRLYHRAFACRNRIAGEIFNIGGGMENSLSLLELFALLERELKLSRPLRFTRRPRRQSDQDVFVADIRKAQRLLQWSPRVSCADGVRRMLEWSQRLITNAPAR